jgi:methanogenic corrinoid protein MtbC1
MNPEAIVETLFSHLISGNRVESRKLVENLYASGLPAERVTREVLWPILENVHALHRNDQLSNLAHHYATRLLRMLVDQAQARYDQKPRRNRKVCLFCGPNEPEELAGQLVADLCEADGYEVLFAGGGVAMDEILEEVQTHSPDVLLMFASSNRDAPNIRQLIDAIRQIGSCPNLQIVVGGGIFNRAPGLAEEIGADLNAKGPAELLDLLANGISVRHERNAKRLRSRHAA